MSGYEPMDFNDVESGVYGKVARNNITVRGVLPTEKLTATYRSPTLAHAYLKQLRLYRRFCR